MQKGRATAGVAVATKPFVGRATDLAELRAALEEAIAGHGSLVLVAGEPGIGKTRLAERLALEAAPRGAAMLWGTAWEGGGAPPFWPWIQVLRQLLREGPGEDIVVFDLGDPGMADVARMLPELAGRVPEPAELAALRPDQVRFRLFDAITTLLARACEARPLLLVLDDLHWADMPSLLLLRFLAQELYGVRLLVLGAYRDVEAGPGSPIEELAGALGGSCYRIVLRGLSPDEVGQLIAVTTGQAPAPDVAASIGEHTGGNPLFVREVARLLAAGVSGGAVPEGVRPVLGRRLDLLSQPCHELLAAASVFGRELRLDLVQALTSTPAEETLELLGEAVAARLVEEMPGTPNRWRFAHALVREVLYGRLSPTRRLVLHRRAGEVIEARFSGELESHLVELADHFHRAGPTAAASAVDYAARAGQHALALLAWEEAAGHFQRALDALDLAPALLSGDLERRCELELALAEARMAVGEVPSARTGYERAAAVARRLGSAEHLARAALGLGVEEITFTVDKLQICLLEEALGALGDGDGDGDGRSPQRPRRKVQEDIPVPVPVRRDAFQEVPQDALRARLHARLRARLARALEYTPQVDRRVALCDEAVAIARQLDDPATLAAVLVDHHRATLGVNSPAAQLATTTEIVQLAESAGDRVLALQGRLLRSLDLLELGETAAMRAEVDAYQRGARESRQPHLLWPGLQLRMTLAIIDGHFDDAKRLNDEALTIGRRAGDPLVLSTHLGLSCLFQAVMGDLAALEGPIRQAVQQWPAFLVRIALVMILADSGKAAEARQEFDRLAADEFASLPHDVTYITSLAVAAVVAYGLGDAARATILDERLEPYAGQAVRGSRLAGGCFWVVDHHLGLLAATMGRYDAAVAHFDAALRLEARMGALPYLATTRYYYAQALAARSQPGDKQQAARELDEALGLLRRLGIRPLFTSISVAGAAATPIPSADVAGDTVGGAGVAAAVLRPEGEYWTIAWQGSTFRLRDTVGLAYLARLLATPGRELHALELAAPAGAGGHHTGFGVDVGAGAGAGAGVGVEEAGLGPVLDEQAKAAYRRRLRELDEELAEAEDWRDTGRAERAHAEREQLATQLAAAVGLGGRDRPTGASAERARVSVTKALRAALRRIAEHNPALGEHLHRSIRTGTFCTYDPDPVLPVTWALS